MTGKNGLGILRCTLNGTTRSVPTTSARDVNGMYAFDSRVGETIRIGDIATLEIHSVEDERILFAVDCAKDIEVLPVFDRYQDHEAAG